MVNSITIARAMLDRACEKSIAISPLKLQKLMYYCQGYSLATYGVRAFDGDIKAWKHGPVVELVYHEYKQYGNSSISHEIGKYFFDLNEENKAMIDFVLCNLGNLGAWELRNKTHREQPWKESFLADSLGSNKITDQQLERFFISELAEKQDLELAKILDASEKFVGTDSVFKLPEKVLTEDDFVNWINE
jgi:uncharacterized phage-associated protein